MLQSAVAMFIPYDLTVCYVLLKKIHTELNIYFWVKELTK